MTDEFVFDRDGQKLRATITMKQCPRQRAASSQRLPQRVTNQCCGLLPTQRPTEQALRVAVHDDGQVAPLAVDLEIGHIADPHLIDARHHRLAERVLDAGEEPANAGLSRIQRRRAGHDAVFTHQPLDPPPANRFPRTLQLSMNARAPIRFIARTESRLDFFHQTRILLLAGTRCPRQPRVESARAHFV